MVKLKIEKAMNTSNEAVLILNHTPTWMDVSDKVVVYANGKMFVEGDGNFEIKEKTLIFKEPLNAKDTTL